MSPEEVAQDFGLGPEEARRALEIHAASGRPLAEVAEELRLTGASTRTGRDEPLPSPEKVAEEFGVSVDVAREALSEYRKHGGDLAALLASRPASELPKSIGRYEVLSLLGRGGGGAVYRVRNPNLGRIEALKLLGGTTLEDRARFERETRVLGQLNHPNIVPIYEVGIVEGRPYYTMECVAGESVADILKRTGALPPRAAMIIARDSARALAVAHERGIVHRDVKPHNILIAAEGRLADSDESAPTLRLSVGLVSKYRVLLTDFGLARVVGEQSLTVESGIVVGTLFYMPPEQVNAERTRVGERSDLYSLGATLYQMLTGRIPFEGDTVLTLQLKITCEEPTPLRKLQPGLSKDVETIVMKCLEKDPARRYPTVRDFADDVERYLRGQAIRARPAGIGTQVYRIARRHRTVFATAFAAMLVGGVAAFVFGVLPALRESRRDSELLRGALADKKAREESFARALREERFEEAIKIGEPIFGRRPLLPKLHNVSRAKAPEYDDLDTEYRIDLGRAYLGRARVRLSAGQVLGRVDLAHAYRVSLRVRDEATGREALLALGDELERTGQASSALAMYRLCESRFSATPETLARLARAFERAGMLEEAAIRWGRLGNEEADRSLPLLRLLLPRGHVGIGGGAMYAGDLDGEGGAEVFHISPEGVLTAYRRAGGTLAPFARLELGFSGSYWRMALLDLDGDGRRELVVGVGLPRLNQGRVFAIEWDKDKPQIADVDDKTGTFATHFALRDLDGDRLPELIVALGYYQRALQRYRYRNGKLARLGDPIAIGCDPEYFAWVGDGLMVHVGPWDREKGFRAWRLAIAENQRIQIAAESVDRFHAEYWLQLGSGDWVLTACRAPQEVEVVPTLAPSGLYRLTLRNGEFDRLQRLLGPWREGARPTRPILLRFAGTTYVAAAIDHRLEFSDLEGKGVRRLELPGKIQDLLTADLDGDGEPELLLREGGLLRIWGLEGMTNTPAILGESGTLGRQSAGEDLLEAELFEEAAEMFRRELERDPRNSRLRYNLGLAHLGLKEYRDAAGAFREAAKDPAYAAEAGLRWIYALQNIRDWKGTEEALRFLDSTPGVDRFARETMDRLREWILPASRMERAFRVDSWTADRTLICENPLESRIQDGILELWDNSVHPGVSGLSFYYDGGPVRIRMRVSLGRPDWETGIRLGILPIASLSRPEREKASVGPGMYLHYGGGGAGDRTHRYLHWRTVDRTGAEEREVLESSKLGDEKVWYTFDLEYIPGLDRAFVSLVPEGAPLFEPLEWKMSFRLDRGAYVVGAVREYLGTVHRPGGHARGRIASIEVDASTSLTRPYRLPPAQAFDRLLVANGRLVLETPSLELFDEAVQQAEKDRDDRTLWRALLFRALCRFRSRDRKGAAEDVGRAMEKAGEGGRPVQLLVAGASEALTPEERGWFRAAVGIR